MSRSRKFNFYKSVESIEDGEYFIKRQVNTIEGIQWYRLQFEVSKYGIFLRGIIYFNNPRSLKYIQTIFGSSSEITSNVHEMILKCTDPSTRLYETNVYKKGEFKQVSDDLIEALHHAETLQGYEEAMKYICNFNIKYYIANQAKLSIYYRSIFTTDGNMTYTLKDFNRNPIDEDLMKENTIILHGETGYGKTSFALAHFKNPAVIKSKNDLIKIGPDVDGIIFDDMDFVNLSVSNVKVLCDITATSIHDVKYGSITIKAHVPRFICINSEENFWPNDLFDTEGNLLETQRKNFKAISEKTWFIPISKPLFTIKNATKRRRQNKGDSFVKDNEKRMRKNNKNIVGWL